MIRGKIIGLIAILMAIILPLINHEKDRQQEIIVRQQIDNYLDKTTNSSDKPVTLVNNDILKPTDYIAVLEIPQINLRQGIVSKDNPYNNIEYNIQLLINSDMPDIINGNLLLAAHSGSSKVSFFKNLDRLKNDDTIMVYYSGYKYIYKLSNSYIVKKEDEIIITRDKSKRTITLITCKNNSDTEQIVFIGYMVDKERY